MSNVIIIAALILVMIYGPLGMIKVAGYLVQRFKFGIPFKELYAYHKEQDKLEKEIIQNG